MATNEAEVDLVVDVSQALPQLERNLTRIINQAERDAAPLELEATLDVANTLRTLDAQLEATIRQVEGTLDGVEVGVLVEQQGAIRTLRTQLNSVVRATEEGGVDAVEMRGALDGPRTLLSVQRELDAVLARIQATDPEIEVDVEVDQDRLAFLRTNLPKIASGAGRTAKSLGLVGGAGLAAAAGLAGTLNAVGGLVAAFQDMGPAAAVGTTALLAVRGAALTVEVAMIGVEDAITKAFDPSTKPDELEKALKNLAPEARSFVEELAGMREELDKIRRRVQGRFFAGFDQGLKTLADNILPVAAKGAEGFADQLNIMAKSAGNAADILARRGILGNAIEGARQGLENLNQVPGRIVNSLGILAAAASPAFDRITAAIDRTSKAFAERLQGRFESRQLTKDIDEAIDQFVNLLRAVRDLGAGFRNIFQGLAQDGNGIIDIFAKIAKAFRELTAAEEFQTILGELSATASVLADTLIDLLGEAVKQLGPVFAELGPIVREFLIAIGPELKRVLQELGPVLLDIAAILREQLPLAIKLTEAALGLLAGVLGGIDIILRNVVIPIVTFLAELLRSEFVQSVLTTAQRIADALSRATTSFQGFKNAVTQIVNGIVTVVVNQFTALGRGVVTKLRETASFARDVVRGIRDSIVGTFQDLVDIAFSIGGNIIGGLVGGLRAAAGSVISVAADIANSVKETISSALDIRSPSRVTFAQGEFAGEGFALGLESMIPRVVDAVSAITGQVTGAGTERQTLPALAVAGPEVNVFIGAERLDARIDFRVNRGFATRDRTLTQGVRRFG